MTQNYSIRSRLILWLSFPIVLVGILTLYLGYSYTRHEIEEVYDAQLVQSAKVLLQLTQHEITEDQTFDLGIESSVLEHKYERKLRHRIWVNDRLVELSSGTDEFKNFSAPPGFSEQQIGLYKWRFFVFLEPEKGIRIEVAERNDVRSELVTELISALILPTLFFFPAVFLIIGFGARKILDPVVRISDDVNKRNSDDLHPITGNHVPKEIVPLVGALNNLFKRIESSFLKEKEFTDHAAHELRTPLAAMKTQTQVLIKQFGDQPEHKKGLENLHVSIGRATHLVNQLLSLARLQNEEFPKQNLDLSKSLYETIETFTEQFAQKNIELITHIDHSIFVEGHKHSLSILLGNLVENALKYTPPNGQVTVSLSAAGKLDISDNGPGLMGAEKSAVFERFVRVDKTGQTGSGLGLPIAQWIATAHGIDINLTDNKPNGLKITIDWTIISSGSIP
ncbi:MAG: ATP-binding protein [Sneathiella sp.]